MIPGELLALVCMGRSHVCVCVFCEEEDRVWIGNC